MRVYIASMFSDKARVLQRGNELADLGIECTSRWAAETVPHNAEMKDIPDEYHRETAVADIQDILKSDVVILTVPDPQMLVDATVSSSSRGGRHFESGLVYGLMLSQMMDGGRPTRELIIIGKRENVFHHLNGRGVAAILPTIMVIATWGEVKDYLSKREGR